MIAPSEDQFWTDMREGQMKLKIRVRRMKESRDMRGLSAGRLLSFRWGRRGKRGLLRALLCLGDGDRLCRVADGERRAMAGDTKSAGSWRAGRWRRAESVRRGSDHQFPATGNVRKHLRRQLARSCRQQQARSCMEGAAPSGR